jgi:hypothetical protein
MQKEKVHHRFCGGLFVMTEPSPPARGDCHGELQPQNQIPSKSTTTDATLTQLSPDPDAVQEDLQVNHSLTDSGREKEEIEPRSVPRSHEASTVPSYSTFPPDGLGEVLLISRPLGCCGARTKEIELLPC